VEHGSRVLGGEEMSSNLWGWGLVQEYEVGPEPEATRVNGRSERVVGADAPEGEYGPASHLECLGQEPLELACLAAPERRTRFVVALGV